MVVNATQYTRVKKAQTYAFLLRARTFLLNDLKGVLLTSPLLTKKECEDECGFFSHLPGVDDVANFGVLNETTSDHLATLAVDTRNNLLFSVHLGISFDFDTIEFVWFY